MKINEILQNDAADFRRFYARYAHESSLRPSHSPRFSPPYRGPRSPNFYQKHLESHRGYEGGRVAEVEGIFGELPAKSAFLPLKKERIVEEKSPPLRRNNTYDETPVPLTHRSFEQLLVEKLANEEGAFGINQSKDDSAYKGGESDFRTFEFEENRRRIEDLLKESYDLRRGLEDFVEEVPVVDAEVSRKKEENSKKKIEIDVKNSIQKGFESELVIFDDDEMTIDKKSFDDFKTVADKEPLVEKKMVAEKDSVPEEKISGEKKTNFEEDKLEISKKISSDKKVDVNKQEGEGKTLIEKEQVSLREISSGEKKQTLEEKKLIENKNITETEVTLVKPSDLQTKIDLQKALKNVKTLEAKLKATLSELETEVKRFRSRNQRLESPGSIRDPPAKPKLCPQKLEKSTFSTKARILKRSNDKLLNRQTPQSEKPAPPPPKQVEKPAPIPSKQPPKQPTNPSPLSFSQLESLLLSSDLHRRGPPIVGADPIDSFISSFSRELPNFGDFRLKTLKISSLKYNQNQYFRAFEARKALNLPPIHRRVLEGGKEVFNYADGAVLVRFPQGGTRLSLENGFSITHLTNGDIQQVLPDGTKVYFFANQNATRFLLPKTGAEVYVFGDSQAEFHLPGGDRRVKFASGTERFFFQQEGEEYVIFDNFAVQASNKSGGRALMFPDGAVEVTLNDGTIIRRDAEGQVETVKPSK